MLGVGLGGSDGADHSGSVPDSSAVDVTALVTGAITATANASTCEVDAATTALAAAEVSGLAALVRERFPDDSPAQVVARIVETADGTTADRGRRDGFGSIQPYEALNRQLRISSEGTVLQARQQADRPAPVTPPVPPGDRLGGLRGSLLWWGVLGGGALLLAVVVRPLLRR